MIGFSFVYTVCFYFIQNQLSLSIHDKKNLNKYLIIKFFLKIVLTIDFNIIIQNNTLIYYLFPNNLNILSKVHL